MESAATTNPAVFTPEAVQSINRAYVEACDIAEVKHGNDELRLKLAEHIMFLARNGETDEHRLCSLAVIAVIGRRPDRETGGSGSFQARSHDRVSPPAAAPGATGTGDNLKAAN